VRWGTWRCDARAARKFPMPAPRRSGLPASCDEGGLEIGELSLPRSRRQSHYAAFSLDFNFESLLDRNFNSNSMGLTYPIDECRRSML
jgi:hypothetical protein